MVIYEFSICGFFCLIRRLIRWNARPVSHDSLAIVTSLVASFLLWTVVLHFCLRQTTMLCDSICPLVFLLEISPKKCEQIFCVILWRGWASFLMNFEEIILTGREWSKTKNLDFCGNIIQDLDKTSWSQVGFSNFLDLTLSSLLDAAAPLLLVEVSDLWLLLVLNPFYSPGVSLSIFLGRGFRSVVQWIASS